MEITDFCVIASILWPLSPSIFANWLWESFRSSDSKIFRLSYLDKMNGN